MSALFSNRNLGVTVHFSIMQRFSGQQGVTRDNPNDACKTAKTQPFSVKQRLSGKSCVTREKKAMLTGGILPDFVFI